MLKSVEGVFREGKVELLEPPPDLKETRVIITFLSKEGPVNLRARGISEQQAAEMRWGFGAGAEDWDSPDMDIYNDY